MYTVCKAKKGRPKKAFEIRSLWDYSMARALRESKFDETYIVKVANICILSTANEEKKHRKVSFGD